MAYQNQTRNLRYGKDMLSLSAFEPGREQDKKKRNKSPVCFLFTHVSDKCQIVDLLCHVLSRTFSGKALHYSRSPLSNDTG